MTPRICSLLPVLLLAGACAADSAPSDDFADRGAIGKADLIGSCQGACDGPSLDGNCWCDDLCDDFGDCCADKAAICEADFVGFETFRGGFCPPEVDCSSSIELLADGTLTVDHVGEPFGGDHVATVSAADLTAAIAVLTDPALVDLLDAGQPPCSSPTDIFESMTLTDSAGEHRNSVTFCGLDPIAAARKTLQDLADKYIPVAGSFESVSLFRGGFCPPTADCTSRVELFADGTLRVDKLGELDGTIHETTVTDVDLADAVAVITDPALLALLDGGDQVCAPPTDIFESLTVTDDQGEHRAGITFCGNAELEAARDALGALVDKYLP